MFDWCEDHETLAPILEAALASTTSKDQLDVLDVGCGTSSLPFALWKNGERRVVAVDVDAAVISSQNELHATHDGLG
eukprot:g29196.t1